MTRRLRIGYIMYPPRLGGAERYLRDLVHGVDRARFDVHLLAPPWPAFERFLRLHEAPPVALVPVAVLEPGSRLRRDATASDSSEPTFGTEAPPSFARRLSESLALGRRVTDVPQWVLRQLYWRENARRLTRAMEPLSLDVVHAVNGGYPGATSARAAVVAADEAGVQVRILTVCSTPLPRRVIPSLEERLDRRVSAAASTVVLPAQHLADALVELRGFAHRQLKVIPWGIDAPTPPDDRDGGRRRARERLGLPLDGPIVGTLGNFTPSKGHAVLLEAIACLVHDAVPVLGVLGGSGPERTALQRRSRALRLDDSLVFPGSVDDVFSFVQALDAFVLASDIEGLPLVVLEAMSQGIPVVASDVGGMSEAVQHGETGFLVPPRDPEAVAAAVKELLADPVRAEQMGRRASARFARNFTRAVMLHRHEEVYETAYADVPRHGGGRPR